MRFIHTADWHLGRLFHGMHLTEDQHHVLMQLVEVAWEEKVDAVVVAGDVYDRAVPPPEAVELLDEVLSRLVMELGVAVVLIAGNHDSPDRIQFGSRLLADRRLFIRGQFRWPVESIVVGDGFGGVEFVALPYAEPGVVRERVGGEGIVDHDSAMRALMAAMPRKERRRVLVGHAFVVGGSECESERPLSVGGAGGVGADCFGGFDYVALGHLHRPQGMMGGRVRYSGSLLKYSFDEVGQEKGIDVVEMDGAGCCLVKSVGLRPRRDVRRIEGTMAELLKGEGDGKSREDYIEVMLMDEGPVLDAVGRLREVYPNVMSLQRPAYARTVAEDRVDLKGMDERALFRSFFSHVVGSELDEAREKAFVEVVDEMRREERGEGSRVRGQNETGGTL